MTEGTTETAHVSFQREIDCPDSTTTGKGGSLQLQISPGVAPTGGNHDRGRRPSLSQIANIQKQHTIEDDDEDFDEKRTLISPVNKASKQSPGADYCDTLGLFSGLRQDYAWCAGNKFKLNIFIVIRIY